MSISCIRFKGKLKNYPYLIRSYRDGGKTKQMSFYLGRGFKATDQEIAEFKRKYPSAEQLSIDWKKVKTKLNNKVETVELIIKPALYKEQFKIESQYNYNPKKVQRIKDILKERIKQETEYFAKTEELLKSLPEKFKISNEALTRCKKLSFFNKYPRKQIILDLWEEIKKEVRD